MSQRGASVCGHGPVLQGGAHTLAVGGVGSLIHGGIEVPSAMAKTAVLEPIRLSADGFEGDAHADLRVHGGPDKAVCVYPWEHYSYWRDQLRIHLGPAAFGENLTSMGLLETEVYLGDVFRWGGATVQVSQPRRPCFKVGARHGKRDLAAQMSQTRRTGFYFRVLSGGTVGPEDLLALQDVDPFGLSVADVSGVLTSGPDAVGLTVDRVLLAAHLLPARWVAQLEALARGDRTTGGGARVAGAAG